MDKKEYHVVGLTHIDLSWLRDSIHYSECQENILVTLLDIIEQDPEYTFVLEQVAHYRALQQRRPDLIKRLRKYTKEGRVEIAGLASSLDTNGPNGEAYVRNLMLGKTWTKNNLGVNITVGELVDTFGISAQTPQLHTQFGMQYILANRLGGCVREDMSICRGIDGSEVLMITHDNHTPNQPSTWIHWKFLQGMVPRIDDLFNEAAESETDNPALVVLYDENERVPLRRSRALIDRYNAKGKASWKYSSLKSFFEAVKKSGAELTTIDGDLNPVLTGCYGLRPFVRLENRQKETLLLEAEKWAALKKQTDFKEDIENAWWTMSYLHSHDIYSGSFPERDVRNEVKGWLKETEDTAAQIMTDVFSPVSHAGDTAVITLLNGLPWQRQDAAEITLPEGWDGIASIKQNGKDVPFETNEDTVTVLVEVPPVGNSSLTLSKGVKQKAPESATAKTAILENDIIRVECAEGKGVEKIILKETDTVIASDCGAFLTAQKDKGYYQISIPTDGELPASTGSIDIFEPVVSETGQSMRMKGTFPYLNWAGPDNVLNWEIDLILRPGKPRLDLNISIDWKGEATRVRFNLPTDIDSSEGLYEIPFGIVKRKPYGIRDRSVGEWPVYRFTAIEDQSHGIALINTGCIGAEVTGGNIWSMLFRAPFDSRIGLNPDSTSSQHGHHNFRFSIVPYSGEIADSPVFEAAQELNNPLIPITISEEQENESFMNLTPSSVILSAVKQPEDETEDEIIIRFYETAGKKTKAQLNVKDMEQAWKSNLPEERLDELEVSERTVSLTLQPFEICTVRALRK